MQSNILAFLTRPSLLTDGPTMLPPHGNAAVATALATPPPLAPASARPQFSLADLMLEGIGSFKSEAQFSPTLPPVSPATRRRDPLSGPGPAADDADPWAPLIGPLKLPIRRPESPSRFESNLSPASSSSSSLRRPQQQQRSGRRSARSSNSSRCSTARSARSPKPAPAGRAAAAAAAAATGEEVLAAIAAQAAATTSSTSTPPPATPMPVTPSSASNPFLRSSTTPQSSHRTVGRGSQRRASNLPSRMRDRVEAGTTDPSSTSAETSPSSSRRTTPRHGSKGSARGKGSPNRAVVGSSTIAGAMRRLLREAEQSTEAASNGEDSPAKSKESPAETAAVRTRHALEHGLLEVLMPTAEARRAAPVGMQGEGSACAVACSAAAEAFASSSSADAGLLAPSEQPPDSSSTARAPPPVTPPGLGRAPPPVTPPGLGWGKTPTWAVEGGISREAHSARRRHVKHSRER